MSCLENDSLLTETFWPNNSYNRVRHRKKSSVLNCFLLLATILISLLFWSHLILNISITNKQTGIALSWIGWITDILFSHIFFDLFWFKSSIWNISKDTKCSYKGYPWSWGMSTHYLIKVCPILDPFSFVREGFKQRQK